MNLIVMHSNEQPPADDNGDLLRFAVSEEPLAGVIFDGFRRVMQAGHGGGTIMAIPQEWGLKDQPADSCTISYGRTIPLSSKMKATMSRDRWLVISNGRFVTQIDSGLLGQLLAGANADVVAVNAKPQLLACREKIRFTSEGKIAGFRRLYADTAEPAPTPADWPHRLFVKTGVLDRALPDHALPRSFPDLVDAFRSSGLTVYAVNAGGDVTDLHTAEGLLQFCLAGISLRGAGQAYHEIADETENRPAEHTPKILRKPRLIGKVILGKDIRIGPEVVIIGPTIIGNGARIERKATISSAIIGPGVRVPEGQVVQNCVLATVSSTGATLTAPGGDSRRLRQLSLQPARSDRVDSDFRTWPRLSYPGSLKRLADCLAAAIVLILFAPVIPVIALAIKLTSSGPVFFKDRRQGLHGRPFNCLKFRTMRVGSDKIQDKLRVASQVDGPQFKIENDPRITAVGMFLRETYIDEIPQFFNVLVGQMSVVGPRPSPEPENRLCPSWRDARLSVRPGVTGLWQIWRTRQPMKDFQEWIHYDTNYVRELSLRLDLWICWRTFRKMIGQFIGQFG